MATYFHSSESQRDAAPMLFLRESWPTSNSEPPAVPANMMMYMNYPSSSGSCTDTLARTSEQQNLELGASVSTVPQQEILSNLGGSRIGEHDFNVWGNGRSEMPFMQLMGSATGLLRSVQNLPGQGLSLSLGTQIPSTMQIPPVEYQHPNSGLSSLLSPTLSIRDDEDPPSKQPRNSDYMAPGIFGVNSDLMRTDMSQYRMSSISRVIPNSKYLKAAQQLLDEVVSVRKDLKNQDSKKDPINIKRLKVADGESKNENGETSNLQEGANNSSSELSAAEKHDLQNKLAKLLSMLDEVDRRYKQYYHQMQIVVSSFDIIAGGGAAKPYTALALQTISRHFRSLQDAITSQVQVVQKSLGEQDTSPNGKGVGISRLRYVDQQLRQQRALQQLGMMQQHAWRPQRGLPESSVSILRAWLFEHFLHPYPKDSDKMMLARQTGLTRSQVSNWFINARVRLWKPMVEDMYKEEFGNMEMDSNSSSETTPRTTKSNSNMPEEGGEEGLQQPAASTAPELGGADQFLSSKHNHVRDTTETTTNATFWSGDLRGMETEKSGIERGGLYRDTIMESDGSCGRFMTADAAAYHVSEFSRPESGSGVSLTLGLQHCEAGGVPISVDAHHSFVSMRGDGNVYNSDPSSHLLHDFVA
ncbi:hypothetical protein NMG60_11015471 [Bertholletia excelsa]